MHFEEITFEYPCHNQAVERFIQDVSKVSLIMTGEQSRDGKILNIMKSRKSIATFNTKKNILFIIN